MTRGGGRIRFASAARGFSFSFFIGLVPSFGPNDGTKPMKEGKRRPRVGAREASLFLQNVAP
ncbi:MAG: hypothetical protein KDG89_09070 [Geminicoccaceae bacterium]|nr:hypothetical protein [Geminicoccaceae bacterium]